MAIYRLEARVLGRRPKAGQGKGSAGKPVSIVAKAAYRAGERLKDTQTSAVYNYRSRSQQVAHSEIVAPENAPSWATDRAKLWNAVEESEKRKDSQLAREFILSVPHELSAEARRDLVMGFVKEELVSRGMVADVAMHEPKDGKNFHAHVLCSMRGIAPDGFGNKERAWNDTDLLVQWREAWETHCNMALEAQGFDERVDCRSLADQGIDREPQPKIGVVAAAMERKGIETERGLVARWHAFEDRIRSAVKGIRSSGEVEQQGVGDTWWERAQAAFSYGVEAVRGLWRDQSSGGKWQDYESERRHEPERSAPDIEIG